MRSSPCNTDLTVAWRKDRPQRFRRARADPRIRRAHVTWSRHRAGMTEAQAQCSHSTATNESRFTPLTPENDRGHSGTSDDEGS
jgi:hypothetical protein